MFVYFLNIKLLHFFIFLQRTDCKCQNTLSFKRSGNENIGQTDRDARGIRETTLKKLRRLYGVVLADRRENRLPMTLDERYFLENGVRKKKADGKLDR